MNSNVTGEGDVAAEAEAAVKKKSLTFSPRNSDF